MRSKICLLLLFIIGIVRGQQALNNSDPTLLEDILKRDTTPVIQKVLANPDKYRLQIIYTRIDQRKSKSVPVLKSYYYRYRPEEYFYPASLVKLPAAALALEKLNWLAPENVTRKTPLWVNPKFSGIKRDSCRYPSLEENITRMLVMSDNPSFNRVYDFLGQEYIQLRMQQMGFLNARLTQRLSPASSEENRTTGPFMFTDTNCTVYYAEEELKCSKNFACPLPDPRVGKAYIDGRKKIYKPKDFSESNFIPLKDMHEMLIGIMYPQVLPEHKRFELTDEQFGFLRSSMGAYPREAGIPEWDADTNLYDAVRKYILFGAKKGIHSETIRSFNKVGLAYGFVSDCAYVRDRDSGVEYFVSCVLYTNDCDILNAGRYEYNSIGFPFMKRLGELLLEYEKKTENCREREFRF